MPKYSFRDAVRDWSYKNNALLQPTKERTYPKYEPINGRNKFDIGYLNSLTDEELEKEPIVSRVRRRIADAIGTMIPGVGNPSPEQLRSAEIMSTAPIAAGVKKVPKVKLSKEAKRFGEGIQNMYGGRKLLTGNTTRFEAGAEGIRDLANPRITDESRMLPDIQDTISGALPPRSNRFTSAGENVVDHSKPLNESIGNLNPITQPITPNRGRLLQDRNATHFNSPGLLDNPDLIPLGPDKPKTRNLGDLEEFFARFDEPARLPDLHSNPITRPRLSNTAKGEFNQFTRSNRALFRGSLGSVGQEIDNLLTAADTTGEVIAGGFVKKYKDLRKGISDKVFSKEIVPYLNDNKLIPPTDYKYHDVIQKFRDLDDEVATAAERAQLSYVTEKGEKIPFLRREGGYWPHNYDQKVWDNPNNMVQLLMKKYEIPEDVARKLVSRASETGGRILSTAEDFAKAMAKEKADKFKGFQHARELDLEGWRTDPEAYTIHLLDVGKQIGKKRYLGEGDVITGRLKELLDQVEDPAKREEAAKLLKRVLGRSKVDAPTPGARKIGDAISNLGFPMFLQNFVLNNPTQSALTAARSSGKAAAKMIPNLFKRGMRQKVGLESGAVLPIHGASVSDISTPGILAKSLGIPQNEAAVRELAAVAGRDTALDYFNKAKSGNFGNLTDIKGELEKLTMTPFDELMNQSELSPFQLRVAANRHAANTQGLNRGMSKPHHWSGGSSEPLKRAALMFKNFAFIQPDLMLEAIKANPVKGSFGALAGYGALGAGTGAVKDAISSGVDSLVNDTDFTQGWKERQDRRGAYLPEGTPDSIKRGIDAVSQGFAFGLPADILNTLSTKDKSSLFGLINPLFGRAVDMGYNLRDGKYNALGRDVVKSLPLPFIANPLGNSLFPYSNKGKGSGKFKSRFSENRFKSKFE